MKYLEKLPKDANVALVNFFSSVANHYYKDKVSIDSPVARESTQMSYEEYVKHYKDVEHKISFITFGSHHKEILNNLSLKMDLDNQCLVVITNVSSSENEVNEFLSHNDELSLLVKTDDIVVLASAYHVENMYVDLLEIDFPQLPSFYEENCWIVELSDDPYTHIVLKLANDKKLIKFVGYTSGTHKGKFMMPKYQNYRYLEVK